MSTVMQACQDAVLSPRIRKLLYDVTVRGIKKYGQPLDEYPGSVEQIARHAIQEAVDLAQYCEVLSQRVQGASIPDSYKELSVRDLTRLRDQSLNTAVTLLLYVPPDMDLGYHENDHYDEALTTAP